MANIFINCQKESFIMIALFFMELLKRFRPRAKMTLIIITSISLTCGIAFG